MSEDNSFDQTKNNSDDVNENEQAMPTFGEEENQYASENEGQSEITIDETLSDYDTSSTIENDPGSKDNIERPYFSDNYSTDDFVSDENGEAYQPDAVYSDNSYINDDAKVKKKKQGRIVLIIMLAILCILLGAAGFAFIMRAIPDNVMEQVNDITGIGGSHNIDATDSIISKSTEGQIDSVVADITEECIPSIVSITNKGITEVNTFFGVYQQENVSSGSGIIIGKNDSELLIVTNYHVVAGNIELSVVFSDAKTMDFNSDTEIDIDDEDVVEAKVKDYAADKDLAVIAVKLDDISKELMSRIKIATIGDSTLLRPGEQVIAIGNALGYGKSVTTGIVSAVNRDVTLESQTSPGQTVTNKFIQTDAAINAGNSGGALLNMRGELIGINSVKIVSSGVEGMGYAIPISDVESIINELSVKKTRELVDEDKQGYLGVELVDVASDVSELYGVPSGILIKNVEKDSPAEKAGLKKGQIITKFDGTTVNSANELKDRLSYYKAGDKVTITVSIIGEGSYTEKEYKLTLGAKKKDKE